MPTYCYKCDCGEHFERFLPLVDYQTPQVCRCGKTAQKKLTAAAIRPDYAGYSCPVSGKWVEGRKAHSENLKQTGCRILEPGEKEASQRRTIAEEQRFERELDCTADRLIAELPAVKREKLIGEVEGGISATVVRQ